MTATHLLDIRGVCAGYGRTEVLRDIDMTIAHGEIVALLGSNGAGKSTLNRDDLRAICGHGPDRSCSRADRSTGQTSARSSNSA